jgi:hypothetical protein
MLRAVGSLVCLSLLVLVPCGCADRAPAPDGAATPDRVVADLAMLRGEVKIVPPGGEPAPAKVGDELRRGDSLRVGAGAFAVLALGNGYLVRVDEGQTLRLAEVAVLDAPPASEDLETQLARLTSEEERAGAERIAGWHARLQAADSVAPLADAPAPPPPSPSPSAEAQAPPGDQDQAEKKEESAAKAEPEKAKAVAGRHAEIEAKVREKSAGLGLLESSGGQGGGVDAVAGTLGPPREEVEIKRDSGPEVGGELEAHARRPGRGRESGRVWRVGTVRQTAPTVGLAPAEVASRLRSTFGNKPLAECLEASFAGTPLVRLALQVEGGKVVRVEVVGGAATPACLGQLRALRLPGPAAARYLVEVVPR